MPYDAEVAKPQAHVDNLESASPEKDAEWESIVKKGIGKVILW